MKREVSEHAKRQNVEFLSTLRRWLATREVASSILGRSTVR